MSRKLLGVKFSRPAIAFLSILSLTVTGLVVQPSIPKAEAQSASARSNDFDYFADLDGTQYFQGVSKTDVVPGSNYTVEAWIKPDAFVTGAEPVRVIASQNTTTTAANRFSFYIERVGSYYQLKFAGRTAVFAAQPADGIPSDSWSHVAVTVSNGTSAVMYFNGIRVASSSVSNGYAVGVDLAPFTVGANGDFSKKFFGGIDQVKVWANALSADDVRKSMHSWAAVGISGNTLRAHYDFNDLSTPNGTVFNMASTSAYHLLIKGAPVFEDVKSYLELNGKQIFTFPRTYLTRLGGWKLPSSATQINTLVVGGGGAGGWADDISAGGGGGGQVIELNKQSVSASAVLQVQVGQGGVSRNFDATHGAPSNGQASIVKPLTTAAIAEAVGGGHGAFGGYALGGAVVAPGGTGNYKGGAATRGGSGNGVAATGLDGVKGFLPATDEFSIGFFSAGGSAGFSYISSIGGGGKGGNASVLATSGLANTGSGGGGAGQTTGNADFDIGGNGGSGFVMVSVDLAAKCMVAAGGFILSQVPKIRLFGLTSTTPDVRLINESSQVAVQGAFYGEPSVLDGWIYIADRGRHQFKRIGINGSPVQVLGDLPNSGDGVTTDGRYVYAWSSTNGVARYDTVSGEYLKTFIGKGDIVKSFGEVAFHRFKGIGYLFLTNYVGGTDAKFNQVYAVPINGVRANGTTVVAPSSISATKHLFSESKLVGQASEKSNSSGLAIIGDTLYWSVTRPSSQSLPTPASIWSKKMTTANMPEFSAPNSARGASVVQHADAQIIKDLAFLYNLSSDGKFLYYMQGNNAAVFKTDPKTPMVSGVNQKGAEAIMGSGGQPVASCALPPMNPVTSFARGTTNFSMSYTSKYAGTVQHLVEYRVNGGPWVAGVTTASIPATFSLPAGTIGLVETRIAPRNGDEVGEFQYAPPVRLGPVPQPPACTDEEAAILNYRIAAGATKVTIALQQDTPDRTVVVDWGNGSQSLPMVWTSGTKTFSNDYPSPASPTTYKVKICGLFSGFGDGGVTQPNLLSVESWGASGEDIVVEGQPTTSALKSLAYAFNGAKNLTPVEITLEDESKISVSLPISLPKGVTNLTGTFRNSTFNDASVTLWDTTKVTAFTNTFLNASDFNQDLSNWKTDSATSMYGMFSFAKKFNNAGQPGIGTWSTANVTDMAEMFQGASVFNQDISDWNVSKVTKFSGMFGQATAFNQPIEKWKTDSAVAMSQMFLLAKAFNRPIGSWNVSNVTSFMQMFASATAFNQSLQSWNPAAARDFSGMFFQATSFNQPIDWNTSLVAENMSSMFNGATAFNQPINWNSPLVKDTSKMFFKATAFDQVPKLKINALTQAADMFSYSGLSDDKYGEVLQYFEVEKRANRAQSNVILGAVDKTAVCELPHKALEYLTSAALWNITDKSVRIANSEHCGPTNVVKIIPDEGKSHIYGDTVPSIGFTFSESDGFELQQTDWLKEVTCKPVYANGDEVTSLSSAATAASNTYKVACSGPAGTGLGYKVDYSTTNSYEIKKRPLAIVVKNQSVFEGESTTEFKVDKNPAPSNDYFMVTAGSFAQGEVAKVRLASTLAAGSNFSAGSQPITLTLSANSDNYDLSLTSGLLLVSTKTYIITAKSRAKSYGDEITQYSTSTAESSPDFTCRVKTVTGEGEDQVTTFGPCPGTVTVTLASLGDSALASIDSDAETGGVQNYSIVPTYVSGIESLTDIELVNGVLSVTKRKLNVVPTNAASVSYGTVLSANFYDFTITGELLAGHTMTEQPTCSSGYNPTTPRGTVLNVTCSGGSTSDPNYEFVYQSSTLTVTEQATVTPILNPSPADQEIRLTEEGDAAEVDFSFTLSPYSEICFANLLILPEAEGAEPLLFILDTGEGTEEDPSYQLGIPRLQVEPLEGESGVGAVSFNNLPLLVGDYSYELVVDGNCSVAPNPQTLTVRELAAFNPALFSDPDEFVSEVEIENEPELEPLPEPEFEPSEDVPSGLDSANAVVGPSVINLSPRQVPTGSANDIRVIGERLEMVTEVTVDGKSIPFTVSPTGELLLKLPALKVGTYDLKIHHTYGTLNYQSAIRVSGQAAAAPSSGMKTLRYTNFVGDKFKLPQAARSGITKAIRGLSGITKITCTGATSGRRVTFADRRLAIQRAQEACGLAKRLLPSAEIVIKATPAAGIGPRFRSVTIQIETK